MFVAWLLYERQFVAREKCPRPKILKLPRINKRDWKDFLKAIPYWGENQDEARAILEHYAGFAEKYGNVLSRKVISGWKDVEEHIPHGFLSHLLGQGYNKEKLKRVSLLLWLFHLWLASQGLCEWNLDIFDWAIAVKEALYLHEEELILVEASDETEAWKKAEEQGKKKEVSYENAYGDEVLWKFVGVLRVKELVLTDGSDVHSYLAT